MYESQISIFERVGSSKKSVGMSLDRVSALYFSLVYVLNQYIKGAIVCID